MNYPHGPLLLPRRGSRVLRPDACIATLPTAPGKCSFLVLPNNTLLVWYHNGGAQIWSSDGLVLKKLEEETDQPITTGEVLGDERFWTATDHDIKIYTVGGDVVGHMVFDDLLRSVQVENDRVIAVSAKEVSVFSLMGEHLASLNSDSDMNYDFGRIYPPDRLILFKTLNRQSDDAMAESIIDEKESGEIYVSDLLTGDLKHCVASVRLPHKERVKQVVFHNTTMFTLSNDCMRAWAPGLRLLKKALHTDDYWVEDVLALSADQYVSHDSRSAILFSISGGALKVLKSWDFGHMPSFDRISDRRALVAGENGLVALIDLGGPSTSTYYRMHLNRHGATMRT